MLLVLFLSPNDFHVKETLIQKKQTYGAALLVMPPNFKRQK